MTILNQRSEPTLTQHRMRQVETCKLDLSWRVLKLQLCQIPVVEWTMVLKLQRTERMCHALERVRKRMGKVVRGIDAPRVTLAIVRRLTDPIDRRVPHVHVGGGHVNLRA